MPTRIVTVTTYGADGQPTGTQTVTVDVSLEQDNRDTIVNNVLVSMGVNRIYLALPAPTAVQNTAQIQALTRQNLRLSRLVLGLLDSTD